MDKVMIQLRFSEVVNVKGNNLEYVDALYYTPEQWVNIKQTDIDAKKTERIANWLNVLNNPPTVIEPTLEDYINQRDELVKQIDELTKKINKEDFPDKEQIKNNILIEAEKI